MSADSAFFDALSVFALVALVGLAVVAVTALIVDQVGKQRALREAREGLTRLRGAARTIDRLMKPFELSGDPWVFIYAARVGRPPPSAMFTDPESGRRQQIGNLAQSEPFRSASPGVLAELRQARELLGNTPATALQYVLRDDPEASWQAVLGYLERCHDADRVVATLRLDEPRRI
jgi:hypothetical protein